MNNIDLRRYKSNKAILKELGEYLDTHPEIRFSQAIINLGITQIFEAEGDDYEYRFEIIDYYEEPVDQLNRIRINKYI